MLLLLLLGEGRAVDVFALEREVGEVSQLVAVARQVKGLEQSLA